jgi:predicted RNA-binding Zn-ribbon protein involved in translation (DUF1610 family)
MEANLHQFRTVYCASCGHEIRFPIKCRERFCPTCAPYRSSRARKRIKWVLSQVQTRGETRLRLVTLTIRSQKDVATMCTRLLRSFRTLRNRRAWKKHCSGGIYVIEITKSPEGWHAHIHAIVVGTYFPQREISQQWRSITGSPVVDIRLIRSQKAVNYVCKYVTTPSVTPEYVQSVSQALAHLRLWSTFGILHSINTKYVVPEYHCPSCGSTSWMTEWMISRGTEVDSLSAHPG